MKDMLGFVDAPMDTHRSHEIAAWLLRGAGTESSTDQVVASIIASCQDIDGALTPIIGPRAVAAMFHRSARLAGQNQPLLAGTLTGPTTTLDLSGLQTRLAAQTPPDAAAAAGLLLHTFHELLGSLIGASLTERLLRRVWPPMLNSTPQEPSS